ncbi:MAG: hypothetical protein ABGZ49_06590 [Akkermansiaceae bacterium]
MRFTLSLREPPGTGRASGMALDSYLCPTCGSEVKVGSSCSGCVAKRKKQVRVGPKKRKHWEQDVIYDGISIPEDEFEYEEFIEREFSNKPHRAIGIEWYWWMTAVLLAGLIGGGFLVFF